LKTHIINAKKYHHVLYAEEYKEVAFFAGPENLDEHFKFDDSE
jgi:hypothetical protein